MAVLMEEELLTTAEVAKKLRISKPTLYNLIDEGRIKVIKISGKFLFTKSEIERFITEEPKYMKKKED